MNAIAEYVPTEQESDKWALEFALEHGEYCVATVPVTETQRRGVAAAQRLADRGIFRLVEEGGVGLRYIVTD